MFQNFVAVLFLINCANSAKLPPYIKPCSKSDPNLNTCALKNAISALPNVINGDKHFKNAPLNPLHIDEVVLNVGDNLKMKFNDLKIYGIETTKVTDLKLDFDKKEWKLKAFMDFLSLIITYDISGRILILPIVGTGPGNFTLERASFDYSFNYDVIDRKEQSYISIKDSKLTYDADRMYYRLDNLFNGNEQLGTEMNKFLNENWRDINKEIGPSIAGTMNSVVSNVFKNYFNRIPINHLFTD